MEDKELPSFNLETDFNALLEYHDKVYIPEIKKFYERQNAYMADLLRDNWDDIKDKLKIKSDNPF